MGCRKFEAYILLRTEYYNVTYKVNRSQKKKKKTECMRDDLIRNLQRVSQNYTTYISNDFTDQRLHYFIPNGEERKLELNQCHVVLSTAIRVNIPEKQACLL